MRIYCENHSWLFSTKDKLWWQFFDGLDIDTDPDTAIELKRDYRFLGIWIRVSYWQWSQYGSEIESNPDPTVKMSGIRIRGSTMKLTRI